MTGTRRSMPSSFFSMGLVALLAAALASTLMSAFFARSRARDGLPASSEPPL